MVLLYALVTWTIIKTIGKATGPNTFTICITSTYLDPWLGGWISIMITHTSSLCWRVVIFPLKAAGSSSHNVTPGQRETMFFGCSSPRHPNPPRAASHDVSQSERWRSRSLIAIFRAGGRLRAICTIPSSGFGGKFISVTLAAWRWFGGRRTATKKRLAWSATNFLFARKNTRVGSSL